jgi:hypothetical protein
MPWVNTHSSLQLDQCMCIEAPWSFMKGPVHTPCGVTKGKVPCAREAELRQRLEIVSAMTFMPLHFICVFVHCRTTVKTVI